MTARSDHALAQPMGAAGFDFPDTALVSFEPEEKAPPKAEGSRFSGRLSLFKDVVVYLAITLLVGLTWQISRLGLFKAGDDTGYWIGVTGGVMMLLLFIYPLRKHFSFARNWGRMKGWLIFHMLLGCGGPLLILLHSTFHVGSFNAAVAMYSMLVVALSGVVGRFLYARVNRGLHNERSTLKDLQTRAGLAEDDARSRLAFAPKVEAQLQAFEEYATHVRPTWPTHLRQVFWLPLHRWQVYRHCSDEIKRVLTAMAKREHWTRHELARRKRHARNLVDQYLNAVTRVVQFSAYERLFSLWHVAHIPFVYLLVVSAIVHVVAVHAY